MLFGWCSTAKHPVTVGLCCWHVDIGWHLRELLEGTIAFAKWVFELHSVCRDILDIVDRVLIPVDGHPRDSGFLSQYPPH